MESFCAILCAPSNSGKRITSTALDRFLLLEPNLFSRRILGSDRGLKVVPTDLFRWRLRRKYFYHCQYFMEGMPHQVRESKILRYSKSSGSKSNFFVLVNGTVPNGVVQHFHVGYIAFLHQTVSEMFIVLMLTAPSRWRAAKAIEAHNDLGFMQVGPGEKLYCVLESEQKCNSICWLRRVTYVLPWSVTQ